MTTDRCSFCGKPYRTYTVPGAFGSSLTLTADTCGCPGEVAAREAERRERTRMDLVQAWESTNVPERFKGSAERRDLLEDLDSKGGLYLMGPRGTGKTTTACGVLKAYVRREQSGGKVSAKFLSTPDWLAWTRGWDDQEGYSPAATCRLLVLDDIGKGKMTAWAIERLFRLVDTRYSHMRPTVFTSQYNLSGLADRLTVDGDEDTADAIVSRIRETCKGVVFDGEDFRKNA